MTESRMAWAAPATAAALIAQQVGANAVRDGLFLSHFAVETLPYFMGGAAVLAIVAARVSGRLLARFGPVRVVPALLASTAVLFVIEWLLFGSWPKTAAALLYMHSGVLGGIVISAFWSLLNERSDPHSAKPLMARVAGASTFGGFVGGVTAERVAAVFPQAALLPILSLVGGICVAGALTLSRGPAPGRGRAGEELDGARFWAQFKEQALLRDLALVVALAAIVAAIVDYVFKAEAVAYWGKGPQLVRFFGLFYSFTGLGSVLVQALLGRIALGRLGLAGSVASHPAAVGGAVMLGFALPMPWSGLVPRAFDVVVRNSTFRAGYELLYTPIAAATKRSAKSVIDVAFDCAGKGIGALLILILVAVAPGWRVPLIEIVAVVAAVFELTVARRLRAGYVSALEGGMRRQEDRLEQAIEYSMADFTAATSIAALDRAVILQAVKSAQAGSPEAPPADPVVAAIAELRSGDLLRIRAALRNPPRDPLVIAALVQLLARDDVVRSASQALAAFGERSAGEMVSALLDPATPDVVRRRLPLALKSCPSPIARDGLQTALGLFGFDVRLRCGRALLALTDEHPELAKPFPEALSLVDRDVGGNGEPYLVREHVFNLLALALDREPVRIAARAFTTDDAYVRGTALEYLETVLPPPIFATLRPLLSVSKPPSTVRRPVSEVRADLIRAGTTMTVSLDELRRKLDTAITEEL